MGHTRGYFIYGCYQVLYDSNYVLMDIIIPTLQSIKIALLRHWIVSKGAAIALQVDKIDAIIRRVPSYVSLCCHPTAWMNSTSCFDNAWTILQDQTGTPAQMILNDKNHISFEDRTVYRLHMHTRPES